MNENAATAPANPPRLSTTVMLLRDAPELQVLMVARAYEIDFASGALVFPGGKVDAADRDPGWSARASGGGAGEGLALRVAAARECFEEVGVMFATSGAAAARSVIGGAAAAALSPQRGAVERDAASFQRVLAEADLTLTLELFTPFARWIAPEIAPKRFDTSFFLARMPEGQTPLSDGRETTEALWISPQEALSRAEDGRAKIIFPTRMNLQRLSQCGSVGEAMDRFADAPAPTIRPQLVEDESGRPCLTLPPDAGYGPVMEPLSSVMGRPAPTGAQKPVEKP